MNDIDLAFAHHRAGRFNEAEALYREILAQQPGHVDALHLLGALALQAGRFDEAAALLQQLLTLKPEHIEARNNLGLVLQAQGHLPEAIAAFRQALQINPEFADAHTNLGLALLEQGYVEDALVALRQALRLKPDAADAHYNLGNALAALGNMKEAISAFEQAVNINPEFAEAYYNLANALHESGELKKAVAVYRRVLTIQDSFDAHNNLGMALQELGYLTEAILAFQRALELRPNSAAAYNNLGNVLQEERRFAEAVSAFRHALALEPEYAEAYYNLGNTLEEQGQLTDAVASYQSALLLKPDYASAYNNLGNALKDQGKLEAAFTAFRRALELEPDFAMAHSNLLLNFHYGSQCDPDSLFREHQRWGQQHAVCLANDTRAHTNDRNQNRRLRVGYLSPDFRAHSVAFFIETVLATHDRHKFEVYCYASVTRPDAVTHRLRNLSDKWRDVARLADKEVSELIRRDEIDILVDLAGHTAGNRLLVFARKPAPVQVAYLGYPDTTGLATIDYRLTDAWADPPGETDSFHTETLVRLANGFLCYQPPPEAPAIRPRTAPSSGHEITFGCFNNASKVNARVIALWAQILKAIPQARLVMKALKLEDAETRQYLAERFQRTGVKQGRVEILAPESSLHQHLDQYNSVDIALDTFPYNGTTTTCEALWMGVPVITLAGTMHAGRVGVSILSHVGLSELIADSPETYVGLAVDLASDPNRLRELRHGLRERMVASPLCDAQGFTLDLEAAYRQMWTKYCEASTK
jgi:protein O-GlcNAc transferase